MRRSMDKDHSKKLSETCHGVEGVVRWERTSRYSSIEKNKHQTKVKFFKVASQTKKQKT